MTDAIKAKADGLNEWLRCVEPFKILIASLFGLVILVYGWGTTVAGINNRIDNNASDIKVETKAREDGQNLILGRLEVVANRIISRVDGVDNKLTHLDDKVTNNASKASDDRAGINSRLGSIEGQIVERNRERR